MSQLLYLLLLALVALERLAELRLSRRNLAWAVSEGGREEGHSHYPWMVALHSLLLPACALEVWLLARPWRPQLGYPMLLLVGLTMALRYWAIGTLGRRWNTRVVVIPGRAPITTGPYRWLRHPNYLAVVVEIAALPLVHGAWIVAALFSTANLLVLRRRVRVEEAALAEATRSGSIVA